MFFLWFALLTGIVLFAAFFTDPSGFVKLSLSELLLGFAKMPRVGEDIMLQVTQDTLQEIFGTRHSVTAHWPEHCTYQPNDFANWEHFVNNTSALS